VNRTKSRTSAVTSGLAACGLAAAVTLTGCGAGQVSQTANQMPAVNGTNATLGDASAGVDLRNVYLRAPQTRDFVKPGSMVELLFVATNKSPDKADKLLEISSDTGEVLLNGGTTVPAGGVLLVGTPDGQKQSLPRSEDATSSIAMVALTKPISNGLNYNFTFKFQNAGEKTVSVPISAGDAERRDADPVAAGGGEEHH
jgi:copper(I)-binding protein